MSRQPHDTPTNVTAEQGEVMLDGPEGVAVSMTPEAAHESAQRLSRAASVARTQRRPGERE